MNKILLFLWIILTLVLITQCNDGETIYKNFTTNHTIIKEVLVNTTCPPQINLTCDPCPNITCEACQVCSECEDISDYLNRMYGCERRLKVLTNLNESEYRDNLTYNYRWCNMTLHDMNETLIDIKELIELI